MRPEELVEQKLCGPFLLEGHLKGRGHDRVHAERSTHTVVPPLLDTVLGVVELGPGCSALNRRIGLTADPV